MTIVSGTFYLGVVLLLLTCTTYHIWIPMVINHNLKIENQLDNPSQVLLKIYIFNITNPYDIIAGAKPILTEIGPYVYRQQRINEIIDESIDTITYGVRNTYFYVQELSNGRLENTTIVVPNILFAGFSDSPENSHHMLNNIIKESKEFLFIKVTVKEYLFGGYTNKMTMELSKKFNKGLPLIPNNAFGLLYRKNSTTQAIVKVDRGLKDVSKLGRLLSVNCETDLLQACDIITNATDGSIFSPSLQKDTLEYFELDLCHSFVLKYDDQIYWNGISAYHFVVTSSVKQDDCLCKNGKNGQQIIISELYDVDNNTLHIIKAIHNTTSQSFFDIEPNTGLVLLSSKKKQLNTKLKRINTIQQMKYLHNNITTFPLIWIDESSVISPGQLSKLKTYKNWAIFIQNELIVYFFGISIALILLSLCILAIETRHKIYVLIEL